MVTSWFYLLLGAFFFFLLSGYAKLSIERIKFKSAFYWYVFAAFIEAVFMFFRLIAAEGMGDMIAVEIIARGLQWFVVAVSIFRLGNVLMGIKKEED